MKPNIEKGATGTATITGELTLRYATDMLAIFRELRDSESTTIVTNPAQIDITYLQLLWSYYITSKAEGKSVSLEMNLSASDKTLMERTGFSKFLKIN